MAKKKINPAKAISGAIKLSAKTAKAPAANTKSVKAKPQKLEINPKGSKHFPTGPTKKSKVKASIGPTKPHPGKMMEDYAASAIGGGNLASGVKAASSLGRGARGVSKAAKAVAVERPLPSSVTRNAIAQKGGAQAKLSSSIHKSKAVTNIPKPEAIVNKTTNKMQANVKAQTNSGRAKAANDKAVAKKDSGPSPLKDWIKEYEKGGKKYDPIKHAENVRDVTNKRKAAEKAGKSTLSARDRIAAEDAARRNKISNNTGTIDLGTKPKAASTATSGKAWWK